MSGCFETILNNVNDVQEFVPGEKWKPRNCTAQRFEYNIDPAATIHNILTEDDILSDDEEIWKEYSLYTRLRLREQKKAALLSVNKCNNTALFGSDDKNSSKSLGVWGEKNNDKDKNYYHAFDSDYDKNDFTNKQFESKYKHYNNLYENKYEYVKDKNIPTALTLGQNTFLTKTTPSAGNNDYRIVGNKSSTFEGKMKNFDFYYNPEKYAPIAVDNNIRPNINSRYTHYANNATISSEKSFASNVNLYSTYEKKPPYVANNATLFVSKNKPPHTVKNNLSHIMQRNAVRILETNSNMSEKNLTHVEKNLALSVQYGGHCANSFSGKDSWNNAEYSRNNGEVSVVSESRVFGICKNGKISYLVTTKSTGQARSDNDLFEDIRSMLPVIKPRATSVSSFSTASSTCSTSVGPFCPFCKKNGESSEVYNSHTLHNNRREVVCPVLFKHRCENCGATGKQAHTMTYCPQLVSRTDGRRPPSTSVIVKSSMRKSNGKLRDTNLLRQMRNVR